MDIVADVLNQADATKLRIASQHLESLARAKVPKSSGDKFRLAIGNEANAAGLGKATKIQKDLSRVPGGSLNDPVTPDASQKAARKAAMRSLETVLATKMVESMMPKDQSRLYGEGTAGEIWRGFHIEAMGKALASQGFLETAKDEAIADEPRDTLPKKMQSVLPFAG